jgi:glyoxylase-like metal-dependent hydrolase (beta-lactamase superfamily II)
MLTRLALGLAPSWAVPAHLLPAARRQSASVPSGRSSSVASTNERITPMTLATPIATHSVLSAARLTRRGVLGRAALGGGAALLARLVSGPGAVALPHSRSLETRGAMTVAGLDGGTLYTHDSGPDGFNTKSFFYDTGTEVVAFDAQFTPELAGYAIADLRTHTDSPLTWLVITHPNPDKFNGVPVFQGAGATVIASAATAAAMPGVHAYKKAGFIGMGMFTEETYPAEASIDETFTSTHTLELGDGKTIQLQELSQPGVSSTQTVAFIPELNTLLVGDLVHHQMHAWLEGGIVDGQATPTLEGWIADLRELETTFAGDPETMVYGGRGEPAPLSDAVAAQIAFLVRADQIVSDYVAGLGERAAELNGPDAGEHYAAIQAELEEAFPDYAFPDMIGFSVYGLVNSKR